MTHIRQELGFRLIRNFRGLFRLTEFDVFLIKHGYIIKRRHHAAVAPARSQQR